MGGVNEKNMGLFEKGTIKNYTKPTTMCMEVERNQQNIKDTQNSK